MELFNLVKDWYLNLYEERLILCCFLTTVVLVFLYNVYMIPFRIKEIVENQKEILDELERINETNTFIGFDIFFDHISKDPEYEEKFAKWYKEKRRREG